MVKIKQEDYFIERCSDGWCYIWKGNVLITPHIYFDNSDKESAENFCAIVNHDIDKLENKIERQANKIKRLQKENYRLINMLYELNVTQKQIDKRLESL